MTVPEMSTQAARATSFGARAARQRRAPEQPEVLGI
jgi:hypothetical protein